MKKSSRYLPWLCCTLAGVLPAPAALDLDHDSLGDVWQQYYNATGLTASADSDGDGMTNLAESISGTDPLKASSKLDVALSPGATASQRVLSWPSVSGKSYFVESSTDLAVWAQEGSTQNGTGSTLSAAITLPAGGVRKFYRIACHDRDTDIDALSDWEELTACLNPANPQTVAGIDDVTTLASAITATGNILTAVVLDGQAWEASTANNLPEGGTVRLVRTGGLAALSVAYTISGRPVAGEDYTGSYSGTAAFTFGCNQIDLPVTPVKDTHWEVPETLTISLVTGNGYTVGMPAAGSVRIDDFQAQTETLYFAQLTAQSDVTTNGSGYATIWLSGDHTSIRTSLSFTGLTSAQPEEDGAHLHYIPTREIIHHLAAGQILDDVWAFPELGTGSLGSDQGILDALTTNNIYVNVHTMEWPSGEVRGDFAPTQGSITFTPPTDPGPAPAYTGTVLDKDVARLLAQATFGATDALITEVKTKGISTWIDEQMNLTLTPASNMLTYVKASDDWLAARSLAAGLPDDRTPAFESLPGGWWIQSAAGRDQLRQRVAFALSEIFVVSISNSTVRNRHYGTADYYDTLSRNAFGSFRTLLEDVTLHPIMANFLSMIKNQKYDPVTGVSPDENYAREIMQLFTIGLVQLHPDGTLKLDPDLVQPIATYDNSHITELAKVFTGWSYSKQQALGMQLLSQWNNDGVITDNNNFNAGGGLPYAQAAFYFPLKIYQTRHDTGVKHIVNGVTIPAGQSGDLDLDNAMDALVNHPNTPAFIAERLIQRLVTSNPSRGYVYRVANKFINDGSGVRGNLAAVVKTILTDYEARTQTIADQAGYGKQREPIIAFLHLYRAFGGTSGSGAQFFDTNTLSTATPPYTSASIPSGTRLVMIRPTSTINQTLPQTPFSAPSVFNWFEPDYVYPGEIQDNGLVAPEFQLTNETNAVTNPNFYYGLIYNLPSGGTNPGPQPGNVAGAGGNFLKLSISLTAAQAALTSGGATGLVDFLDRLLCAHQMSAATRTSIITAVNGITGDTEKMRTAIYLAFNSPDYIIQR